jgi:thiamine-monophosphate kinase
VLIELRRSAFEVAQPIQAVAAATGADPYTFLFTGGEDHALAATFPAPEVVPAGWLVVGAVGRAHDDHPGVLVDGAVWESPEGFDHFRSFGTVRATEARSAEDPRPLKPR